ncbi:hypothetical protein C8R45DRAFT_976565 [Mycena sanguinolenta]|nr:hypothetical protein C8R45DRAFT_976565 [Mycena sanguinolenta]
MHPSLALSNLRQLHLALRRRALAAAEGNIDELEALNRSGAHLTRLLHVYYSGLDTAAIPSLLAQLDGSEAQILTRKVAQVVICLQGLLSIDSKGLFPQPPSADLWLRVWPWLEFLDTYHDLLPPLLRPEVRISDFSPLLLINVLARDEATARLMVVTPGFRILIFRVWAQSFDQKSLVPTQNGSFDTVCVLMQNVPLTVTAECDFEEAIEGSGGSRLALARLCVNHVKSVVKPAVMSPGDFSMRTVLLFLQRRSEADLSFRSPSFAQQNSMFIFCWAVKYYLRIPYGHDTITEALRAGLLRALLAYGRMAPPPEPQYLEQLDEILIFFSRSSVYLSFLLQLRLSIEELNIPIDGQTFRGFSLSDKWESLWSILQVRWDFMEKYLRREKTTVMATCSNMSCQAIAHKSEFKCCSICKSCKYCSKACQTHDWQHGGHRQLCGWSCGEPGMVSRQDRSFMRALLHHDYLRMKHSILTEELVFLRSNPGTPFHVRFDYCTPSVTGTVQVSVEAISSFPLDNDMWRYQVARVKESGGRLEMHVMQVLDGGCNSVWLYPLRSSSGDRRTGLEILAAETTVGDARDQADRMEIQRLAELDILEVHD